MFSEASIARRNDEETVGVMEITLRISKEIATQLDEAYQNSINFPGDYGGGVPPVPIPNTAVKPSSADGTWIEGSWESKSLPGSNF